jgi:hypothetical protein
MFSSPLAADEKICIGSRNGIATIIDAEEKIKIPAQNNQGDIIRATSAVADNQLYINILL